MDDDAQDENDNEQNGGPAVSYKVLGIAAFHNWALVLDWLENSKDQQDDQWQGSLLSQAAYYHNVDMVRCIITPGNSDGQSANASPGLQWLHTDVVRQPPA